MEGFIHACIAFRQLGFSSLRIQNDLFSCELCEDYRIYNWREDQSVELDLRRRFKSILINSPSIPSSDEENTEVLAYSQFLHKNIPAIGLGAAYLLQTISLSFNTCSDWEKLTLKLFHEKLSKDSSLEKKEVSVKNSFNADLVFGYKEWFERERVKRLNNSKDLWKKRDELFGKLIFCPC